MVVTTTDSQGGGTTQVPVAMDDGVNAFGVIIRYQSSDFATTKPTTTLSSPSQQASITNPQASITSPRATSSAAAAGSTLAATTSTPMPSSGLPTDAKIGIGVGVGGGLLLLLVIAAFCLLGRTRRRAYNSNNIAEGYTGSPPHEIDGASSAMGWSPEPTSPSQIYRLVGITSSLDVGCGRRPGTSLRYSWLTAELPASLPASSPTSLPTSLPTSSPASFIIYL
jgi:hypothetical protein